MLKKLYAKLWGLGFALYGRRQDKVKKDILPIVDEIAEEVELTNEPLAKVIRNASYAFAEWVPYAANNVGGTVIFNSEGLSDKIFTKHLIVHEALHSYLKHDPILGVLSPRGQAMNIALDCDVESYIFENFPEADWLQSIERGIFSYIKSTLEENGLSIRSPTEEIFNLFYKLALEKQEEAKKFAKMSYEDIEKFIQESIDKELNEF